MRAESLEDLEDGSCARRERDAGMWLPSTQVGLEEVGDLTVDTGSLWHWRPNCRLWAGFLW